MRVLLQRVASASVTVDGEITGKIEQGLLLLVGFGECDRDDADSKITKACDKLVNLRVFENEQGKLDHSVIDLSGAILAVPQFTLYGKSLKGRRPDFTDALQPALATLVFDKFTSQLGEVLGKPVATGVFGANMQVALVNDGPLTLHFDF